MRKKLLIATLIGTTACAASGEGPPPGEEDLIDDLEDGDDAIAEANGRLGGWYTFNDMTVGGTQTPPETGFVPTAGGADGSAYAAATSGKGFTEWGAGMGFDLNNPEAVGMTGPRGTYDVTPYRGIAFYAKSNVPVRLAVATTGVTATTEGGLCTPSTTMGQECDDTHGANLSISSDWKEFTLEFADLRQGGWGKVVPFEPTDVMAVLFQVDKSLEFDFAVDNVRFYE